MRGERVPVALERVGRVSKSAPNEKIDHLADRAHMAVRPRWSGFVEQSADDVSELLVGRAAFVADSRERQFGVSDVQESSRLESARLPAAARQPLADQRPVRGCCDDDGRFARLEPGGEERRGRLGQVRAPAVDLHEMVGARLDAPTDTGLDSRRVAPARAACRLACNTPRAVARGDIEETTFAETVLRVAKAVAAHDDLHEVVQVVTDETTAITGAQFGAFFYNVVGLDGESYSLYTIAGVPRERFEKFPMPRNTDIFRPTFEGTGTMRIDDVTADPRYGRTAPYHGMPPGHLPVRSYLAVPVFGRSSEVIGGLFFGHARAGVFTSVHEKIAEAIAAHAGVAVEKAQLLAAERTARSEAEARADAALALEVVGDGIALVDDQGVVRLWNPAAETITGRRAAAVLGRPIGQAVAGWEQIALRIPIGDRAASTPVTLPLDTLKGREVWLSLYGIAFSGGVVYAFRDVTDRRRLESLREDVIATVSHELRTPVTAVYGAARTLRVQRPDEKATDELLQAIEVEAARLAALVDDVLLTSQIDANRISLVRTSIDPREAVEAATVGAASSQLHVDLDGAVAPASGDPQKLGQVLANLVENALKYGQAPVTVKARDLQRAVRFEVSDCGEGIPRDEQQRIFEKFYRRETHLDAGLRGTGLGLYICRELVHRMDGRIGVESSGAGTTFWVELPRHEAA